MSTVINFRKGCHFYVNGLSEDIDHIKNLLESGEKILDLLSMT